MERYVHKVNYYETDKMGVTHHSNYVRIMEEARIDFLAKIGWSYEKFEEIGIISPVLNINCNFKKTTTFPDVISVEVDVLKVTSCKLEFGYTFYCNDQVVFTASSLHCFLDENGRPVISSERFPALYKTLTDLIKK